MKNLKYDFGVVSQRVLYRRNVGYILDMQKVLCYVNCPTEFSQGVSLHMLWVHFNLHLWNNYFCVLIFGFRIKVNTSSYSWVLNVFLDFVTFTNL